MAIPEHSKCVASHKQSCHEWHHGNWRRVRAIRRKNGSIKPKMRIRQILKVEFAMQRSRIIEQYQISYTAFNKITRGMYYKRWGKYDD